MTIVAGHSARNRTRTTLRGIAITVVIVALAFPVIWMVLASLKNALSIGDPSQTFVFTPTLDNYVALIEQNDFLHYILNSAIVAIAATALALLVGLPAAYAIARHSMGRTNMLILAARIIPWISLLVPWYFLFAQVGFVGTYWALIIAHLFVTLPLVVWIMTGFFETLPTELEEAAQVDGLSPAGAFWRIAVPLARPGIATAALLGFIFSWNNFLFSLVLGGNDTRTLPVALFNFIAYASVDWGGLMAASVVTMIPVAVLAVLAQRHIVAGLTAGATKG